MDLVKKVTANVDNYEEIAELVQALANALENDSNTAKDLAANLVAIFGELAKKEVFAPTSSKQNQIVAKWLTEQLKDFSSLTLKLCTSPEESVAVVGFNASMKIVLIRGKYQNRDIYGLISDLVDNSLNSKADIFAACWLEYLKYDDVRYYFFKALAYLLEGAEDPAKKLYAQRIFDLLQVFDGYPSSEREVSHFYAWRKPSSSTRGSPASFEAHKVAYNNAWLASLRLPLSLNQIKVILTIMHVRVIPNMSSPQLLMDFLRDAYEYGGSIALLSLNSIFELIQRHGLEYPNFWTKLYMLLFDASVLCTRHRSRFLRLLDLFLTSSHLSASIPASFIKRLARLCLFAPPGAVIAIIPFIYNQIKRHPTCMLMIQRETKADELECDPFDFDELDPLKTHALESSLWELAALTQHYQPNIATLAKIFSQPFRKPNYRLDDFLVYSYDSLYRVESKRVGRADPALEFEELEGFESNVLEAWAP